MVSFNRITFPEIYILVAVKDLPQSHDIVLERGKPVFYSVRLKLVLSQASRNEGRMLLLFFYMRAMFMEVRNAVGLRA